MDEPMGLNAMPAQHIAATEMPTEACTESTFDSEFDMEILDVVHIYT